MQDADVLDLRDYLRVLRRRWVTIVVVAGVTVATALGVTLVQTPIYEAEAELAIEPVRRSEDVTLEELILGDTTIETEKLVVTSNPVTERVIDQLELDVAADLVVEQVDVAVVADTRVVRIAATDPDPADAAALANAYAAGYLDYRRDRAVEELQAAQQDLEQSTDELGVRIAELDAELADADGANREVLAAERASLLAQIGRLAARSSQLEDSASVIRGGGAVLSEADVPDSPIAPRPLRTSVLALVLGLMLGVGLAFLRDYFDDVLRTDDELKRITGGAPVLGHLPRWGDPGDPRLVTLIEPHSVTTEAYRILSTNVRFLVAARRRGRPEGEEARDRGVSLVTTSPRQADGKTTTVANLAVAAARAGMEVILVDADLRQATVAGRFGLGCTAGLSDLLVSDTALDDHLIDVGVPHLLLLPAGTRPPNPAELLASPRFAALRRQLEERADLVLFDAPPVLVVSDALEVAAQATMTAVIAFAERTSRRGLVASVERLAGVGVEVAGTVLNGIDRRSEAATGSYGYYGYDRPDGSRGPDPGGDDGAPPAGEPQEEARHVDGDQPQGNGQLSESRAKASRWRKP